MRIHKYRYRIKIPPGETITTYYFSLEMIEVHEGLKNVKIVSRDEFTGFHDKNGVDPTVELYEKDLIQWKEYVYVVEQSDTGAWILQNEKNTMFFPPLLNWAINSGAKKVGNFYEHPDHLKGEKK